MNLKIHRFEASEIVEIIVVFFNFTLIELNRTKCTHVDLMSKLSENNT